ncbi:LpxD N-terminal domain-containing protein, partial [uncultured Ramlibacter sp.]|uniref:LpxD N-terminal domain-containing protein n=1 Tax=uncultured Ramlibacter sp. TaxID=260755 RepID=UPI00261D3F86
MTGLLVSGLAAITWFGVIPVQMFATAVPWTKMAYAGALALAAGLAGSRLSRDDVRTALTPSLEAARVLEPSVWMELETIAHAAPLDSADAEAITFFSDAKRKDAAAETRAGACFVRPEHRDFLPATCAALLTRHPQAAWAAAVARLHAPRRHEPASKALHAEAMLEEGVLLSPVVTVGPGARIGRGTRIG